MRTVFVLFCSTTVRSDQYYYFIEASTSTKQIYEATGVKNSKVTHHRTAALQMAGFQGLRPDQINTLTNHMLDKQHSAYQAQAEWEVRVKLVLIVLCNKSEPLTLTVL